MRRLRCGQSITIGRALASIAAVGIFWLLFSEAWNPLNAECDEQVINATAQQTCDWLGFAWEWYLAITLGITVMGVIAASVYQRQGGV